MRIEQESTDKAILAELGARVRHLRLRRNITQEDLAAEAGVSRPTVHAIEDGKPSQLVSVIRVLRALGIAGRLQELVPEAKPSPIELLELQGRERQRARGGKR